MGYTMLWVMLDLARVRGYQVRKKYRVICWAVDVLDKVVLCWRCKCAGLRGTRPEPDSADKDEDDDDIIKPFRDDKVSVAIAEAVTTVKSMVAALIASGASAGALTDPSSQDPSGKNAAYIAGAAGHKGLAGYLSEVALTSHLLSLTLLECELSNDSADVKAELTTSSISKVNTNSTEDQIFLKHTLAAVSNASQAAASIQAAFHAHCFRKRQYREASCSGDSSDLDEYGLTVNDFQGLPAMFHYLHDHHNATLSIQKNFRGWKGRKDFLTLRQKVVRYRFRIYLSCYVLLLEGSC